MIGIKQNILKTYHIKGQALAEILVAMSVLVLLFIVLLSVQLQSTKWVADSRALTRAGQVSFSLLEALRGGSLQLDWTRLESGDWVRLDEAIETEPLGRAEAQTIYIQTQKEENGLYLVAIKVEWGLHHGKNSVEMYTRMRRTDFEENTG